METAQRLIIASVTRHGQETIVSTPFALIFHRTTPLSVVEGDCVMLLILAIALMVILDWTATTTTAVEFLLILRMFVRVLENALQ